MNYSYSDSVAQLGEHYLDRVGVGGSSPLGIIMRSLEFSQVIFLRLFLDFG